MRTETVRSLRRSLTHSARRDRRRRDSTTVRAADARATKGEAETIAEIVSMGATIVTVRHRRRTIAMARPEVRAAEVVAVNSAARMSTAEARAIVRAVLRARESVTAARGPVGVPAAANLHRVPEAPTTVTVLRRAVADRRAVPASKFAVEIETKD